MSYKVGDKVSFENPRYKGFFGVIKSVLLGELYKVEFDKLSITLTCVEDDLELIS